MQDILSVHKLPGNKQSVKQVKMVLKKIFAKIIYYSGLPFLIRELIQRNYVTILVLHDPDAGKAERMLSFLKTRYNIIDLNLFLNACEKGSNKKLPQKSLIITFDDGHIGNYKLLPFLKTADIPVTIFLCAGIVNTNRHFWFKHSGLGAPSGFFKQLPDEKRLGSLSESGFYQDKEYETTHALNNNQIHEMEEYVNFQSHTIFHPCLPQCSNDKSWIEINESKKILESEFHLKINAIAYPNGDYSEREKNFARKAGYSCALSIDFGYNTVHSDLYKLRRICLNDKDDIEMTVVKACGIWGLFK
jgi:peptidoglycan/xylan/chitin deacetylase (PgdA/CDA1 family)